MLNAAKAVAVRVRQELTQAHVPAHIAVDASNQGHAIRIACDRHLLNGRRGRTMNQLDWKYWSQCYLDT
jgi:hypothetical protein